MFYCSSVDKHKRIVFIWGLLQKQIVSLWEDFVLRSKIRAWYKIVKFRLNRNREFLSKRSDGWVRVVVISCNLVLIKYLLIYSSILLLLYVSDIYSDIGWIGWISRIEHHVFLVPNLVFTTSAVYGYFWCIFLVTTHSNTAPLCIKAYTLQD